MQKSKSKIDTSYLMESYKEFFEILDERKTNYKLTGEMEAVVNLGFANLFCWFSGNERKVYFSFDSNPMSRKIFRVLCDGELSANLVTMIDILFQGINEQIRRVEG